MDREQKRIAAILEASSRIEREALRCFRPLPNQEAFFKSESSELILRGGNRCLGGEQEIYDPVAKVSRRVDSIDGDFHVWSKDPLTGKTVIGKASKPFIKATGWLYRAYLSNGETLVVTPHHLVFSSCGWLSIGELHRQSVSCLPATIEGTFPSAFPRDEHDWNQTTPGSQSDCRREYRSCDERLRRGADTCQDAAPLQACAHERTHHYSPLDALGNGLAHIRACRESARLSMMRGATPALLFSASESHVSSRPYSQPSAFDLDGLQSLAESCRPSRTIHAFALSANQFASVGEVGDRRCEYETVRNLHCTAFDVRLSTNQCHHQNTAGRFPSHQDLKTEPFVIPCAAGNDDGVIIYRLEQLRYGEVWDFEVETYHNYIAGGVLSHNSGKSTCAATICASVATGVPITCADGTQVHPYRNPERGKLPMLVWVIGYDQKHIGQTLHRLLLEPGLFQVIRDEQTGEWRQFRPWMASDTRRAKEARPAEPLIPQRFIENITWVSYGQKIFEAIYLTNGTKICAYASTGEPKQGDAVDWIWIDEDVAQSRHIGEWQARLSDRKGRLIWSAFPHSKNNALVRMSERAAEQADRPKPDITEVVLKFRDNPWIDAEEKRKRIEGWSAEEARARDLGEFTYDTVLMYDWSPAVQGVPNAMGEDCPINRYWEKHRRLPDDWTRYLVLDPGHTTTAIMFAAVPPPVDSSETDWGDVVVIEDELYMHKATCSDIAREVQQKVAGRHYEAFIIDMHAGRQTPMGGAETIKAQYARAFENKNIKSARTGSTFINGSDNTTARREILRTWMQPTERGGSRLRIVLDKCPFVQRELKTYRKRITSDNFIEDEPAKSPHDAIDGLEYLAAFNPRWVRRKRMDSPGMSAFKSAKKLFMGLFGKDEHEPIFLGAGKG